MQDLNKRGELRGFLINCETDDDVQIEGFVGFLRPL